jgi:Domain of unknown function (DUF6436)
LIAPRFVASLTATAVKVVGHAFPYAMIFRKNLRRDAACARTRQHRMADPVGAAATILSANEAQHESMHVSDIEFTQSPHQRHAGPAVGAGACCVHRSNHLINGVPRAQHSPGSSSDALAWVALGVWLLCTVGGFWALEMRDWRTFGTQGVPSFDLGRTKDVEAWFQAYLKRDAQASGRATLTVVHLYNPDCRCNLATEQHLQRLIERYRSRGVRFVAVLAPVFSKQTVAGPLDLPVIVSDRSLADAGINTAPGAMIFDGDGRLIYYGPYSDSAWCGSAGGLVEPILERALAGRPPTGSLPTVRGCFCVWQSVFTGSGAQP